MLRSLIFGGVLLILGIIATILVGIIGYKTGMFDEMIEAKKAAIEAQKAIKDSIN